MMKRMASLALAAMLLLGLGGCGNWEGPEQDDVFQTLADYYGKDDTKKEPTSLTFFALPYYDGETADPITCSDGAQQVLGALLYEGLFALTPDFQAQPMLASGYSYDPASYTYTITLREGVSFSDGTALSARDVIYTLERAQQSQRYAGRLADVSRIYGSGNTVYLRLNSDNAAFIQRLDIPIVKYGTGGRTFPVGTGPYVYQSDDAGPFLGVHTGWWQQKSLPLQRIELVGCKDSDTMSYAFYAREIQLLMCDLTATTGSNVYGSGEYIDAATTTMQYIGVNTRRTPLNDPALRQALSLGIDRSSCVSSFLLGHGSPAQFPLSPAAYLYPEDLEQTYSPDYFDTAMKNAGYDTGTTVSLTLLVNSENSFKVSAAQKIAADLSRHDIQITVKSLPWSQYLQALQTGDFDLYYGEIRLTADWDLRSLLGSGGSLNYGGYSHAETDLLLQSLLSASDAAGQTQAARELCLHLQQQCPILPVCFKNVSVLLPSNTVESVIPTAANPFYNLPDWDINIQS